jgi:FtsX-like permease family protein
MTGPRETGKPWSAWWATLATAASRKRRSSYTSRICSRKTPSNTSSCRRQRTPRRFWDGCGPRSVQWTPMRSSMPSGRCARSSTVVGAVAVCRAALLAACGGRAGCGGGWTVRAARHQVAARTREIGIRMALGASHGQIVRFFAPRNARVFAAGLLAGLPAGLMAGRSMNAAALRRHTGRCRDICDCLPAPADCRDRGGLQADLSCDGGRSDCRAQAAVAARVPLGPRWCGVVV